MEEGDSRGFSSELNHACKNVCDGCLLAALINKIYLMLKPVSKIKIKAGTMMLRQTSGVHQSPNSWLSGSTIFLWSMETNWFNSLWTVKSEPSWPHFKGSPKDCLIKILVLWAMGLCPNFINECTAALSHEFMTCATLVKCPTIQIL